MVRNQFKTYTKALLKANIPVEYPVNISKEDIENAIKKWYKQNNEKTSCLEYWCIRKARFRRKFPYSGETISKKFGNIAWEDIMVQFDPTYKTKNPFICCGKFKGEDGNIYKSSIEKEVADILFNMNIKYKYEKKICDNRDWTCDFFIKLNKKNIWLEVDGMRCSRKIPYTNSENKKIKYYKENNYKYYILSYNIVDIKKFLKELVWEEI